VARISYNNKDNAFPSAYR